MKYFRMTVAELVLLFVAVSMIGSCGGSTSSNYTVGGRVAGLAVGEELVLQNNLKDDLSITSDGDFTFETSIADGAFG